MSEATLKALRRHPSSPGPTAYRAQLEVGGVGIGLRASHIGEIIEHNVNAGWLEILVDNYLDFNSTALSELETLRARYPFTFHGVGMNLGSTDPLDVDYLHRIKELIARYEPDMVSDHLAWIGADGRSTPDLLPLPYTQATQHHVAERVTRAQDILERRLFIENPSSYIEWTTTQIPEPDFLSGICDATGCGLLLDVNNIYVSCENFGHDPEEYLSGIDGESIGYIHVAGHEDWGNVLVDTHSRSIKPRVYELLGRATGRFGAKPTLVEWDRDIPTLSELLDVRHNVARLQAEAVQ